MPSLQSSDVKPNTCGDSVMIVDDDLLIRDLLQSILTDAGYRVIVASDGNEALTLGRTCTASVALVDINMPNINGLETCEGLRRLPNWAEVPIIIVTGLRSSTIASEAARVGATGMMMKPFSPQLLISSIKTWTARPVQH